MAIDTLGGVGNQRIDVRYHAPANAEEWHYSHADVSPVGVIKGCEVEILDSSSGIVQVNPGVVVLRPSNRPELLVKIEFTQSFQLTLDETNKYIVVSFQWTEDENNTATVQAKDTYSIYDIVIGMGVFDSGSLQKVMYLRESGRKYVSRNDIVFDIENKEGYLIVRQKGYVYAGEKSYGGLFLFHESVDEGDKYIGLYVATGVEIERDVDLSNRKGFVLRYNSDEDAIKLYKLDGQSMPQVAGYQADGKVYFYVPGHFDDVIEGDNGLYVYGYVHFYNNLRVDGQASVHSLAVGGVDTDVDMQNHSINNGFWIRAGTFKAENEYIIGNLAVIIDTAKIAMAGKGVFREGIIFGDGVIVNYGHSGTGTARIHFVRDNKEGTLYALTKTVSGQDKICLYWYGGTGSPVEIACADLP